MTYSLSSVRKIGDYKQKIITTWTDAPIADNGNVYNKMKAWHLLVDDLNDDRWDMGTRNFQNLQATGTESGSSNGNKADVFITFRLKKIAEMADKPTYIQIRLETDNGVGEMLDAVSAQVDDLIRMTVPNLYLYPVNVIINMKNLSV